MRPAKRAKRPVRSPERTPGAQPARAPYVPPRLTEFGSVAKLTQTSLTGSLMDGPVRRHCL
jgi:hypothetical protein